MREPSDGSAASDDPFDDTAWTQVAQRHYDPSQDTELTTALVFTIADGAGIDPSALKSPPLYEYVDAAALEDTFFGTDDDRQGTGTVRFRYTDYLVTVSSDGWIQVYEATDSDPE